MNNTKVLHAHTNSQGERITINEATLDGEPVQVLCVWDDPPPVGTGIPAPTLLDDGTRAWLKEILG